MEQYDKTLFVLVMIGLPVGMVVLSGFVRSITTTSVIRNFYLGVDLAMGAVSLALVSAVDRPSRVMPEHGDHKSVLITFTFANSTGVAMIVDLFLLIPLMLIQKEYELWVKRKPNPSRGQKWAEVFVMLVFYNILGVLAMAVSAYVLRY
jgi:hypothetical protein